MKIDLKSLIVIAVVVIAVVFFVSQKTQDQVLQTSLGNEIYTLEIADSQTERALGLSGRDNLPEKSGILFMFPEAKKYSFWMKDMNFPIDIIWINEEKVITEITRNVSPDTFPQSFTSKSYAMYVIEINAGESIISKIKPGQKINF